MPAKRSSSSPKEQSIKVNVVATPRSESVAPSANVTKVTPSPVRPTLKQPTKPKEERAPRQPMTDHQRRRVMWWLVGGGAVIVLALWGFTVRYEIRSDHQSSFIGDIVNSIRSFRFPSKAKPTAKEQEVRNLEEQVFPQFSNTNS